MNANVTKEGVEVKVGQLWRDLDYRQNGRLVQVLAVEKGRATIANYSHSTGLEKSTTKLSVQRMHKSSTGWQLVQESA